MMGRVLMVRAGARLVALPVEHLEAVTEATTAVAVPSREPALRGIATIRGQVLPVVHLGAVLDGAACPMIEGSTAVIVKVNALRFCLEVDDADVVQNGELIPMPPDQALPWARALVRRDDDLVPMLDLAALHARLSDAGRL